MTKDIKRAIEIAIEAADDGDAGRVSKGYYTGPRAAENRKYDRMCQFLWTLTGALQQSNPELADRLDKFCDRVIEGK